MIGRFLRIKALVASFLNFVWFALLKGGYQPEFFVKLVFEIAVDQNFEGVQHPNRPSVPVVHPRPYWSLFCPIMSNYRNMTKTKMFGALLVASGLLNYYMKFHQDWTKNGWVMRQKPYAHIWTYAPNFIGFGPLIGQVSIFLKGKHKLHILCNL